MWWVGAFFFGIVQIICIITTLLAVFRKKVKVWSLKTIIGYLAHGVTAVIALWMFLQAIA